MAKNEGTLLSFHCNSKLLKDIEMNLKITKVSAIK